MTWIEVTRKMLSPAEHAILIRKLAGKDAMSGGGLPLPDAFRAVAERLLEEPPGIALPESELTRAVMSGGAIPLRENRILALWDSKENFTRAILALMKQEGLLVFHSSRHPGREEVFLSSRPGWEPTWSLNAKFESGRHYTMFSLPDRDVEIGFTALDPAAKERRDQVASLVLRLRQLEGDMDDSGFLTIETEENFRYLIQALEDGRRKKRGKQARVGTPEPPEDQPELMRMCTACELDKPLTREHFKIYGPSRGLYYWERMCHSCDMLNRSHTTASPVIRRKDVERIISSRGKPELKEVMDILGTDDDRRIRKYWDELSSEGRVPARQA